MVRYRDFGETEEEIREFFDSLIREGGVLTVEQVERLARKKAGNSDTAWGRVLEDLSGSRLAEELRRILDFSLESGSDSFAVFQFIRERVELLGIPVFRLPIDARNIRGSVIHGRIPVIIVSFNDFTSFTKL